MLQLPINPLVTFSKVAACQTLHTEQRCSLPIATILQEAMVNASQTRHFQPVVARSAWKREQYAHNKEWLVTLSPQHLHELRAAVDLHKDHPEAQLHQLKASDFVLPTLGPVLLDLREEIVNGKGFAIVQGLSTKQYSLRYISDIYRNADAVQVLIVFCNKT